VSRQINLFILLFSLYGVYGTAQSQSTTDAMGSRIQNMERLLNQSSGARQVLGSSNGEAMAKREQALALWQQAREKMDQGARDEASALLNRSVKLMFEAIKAATPASMTEDKKKVDYGKRKESVTALRAAFNRIADETGDSEARRLVDQQLSHLIARADGLLATGDYSGAQVEIDKAYHLLKVSIEAKRAGQTLVRSLQFESKEEEYLYEIDRNDTHLILIDLLVDEKSKSENTRKEMDKFVEQAIQLRQQADAYAEQDEFVAAIELLEQSTRQLLRAIRITGVYIPG
jgi:hypothetical protein